MSAGNHSPLCVPDAESKENHSSEAALRPPTAASATLGRLEPAKLPWRSQAISAVIHVFAVAVILALSFPDALVSTRRAAVHIVAPKLEPYKPERPHRVPMPPVRRYIPPPVAHTPPVAKLDVPAPPRIAEAPAPKLAPVVAQPKIEVPQAPRPQIVTGVFGRPDAATPPSPPPKQVIPAGFGDAHGVRPQTAAPPSSLTVARLGGFDVPGASPTGHVGRGVVTQGAFGNVDGTSGTPSQAGRPGGVRASGFGDGSGTAAGTGTSSAGTVRTSGFDAHAQKTETTGRAAPSQPVTTPPEILFKPKPVYTEEARRDKIEGQVSFEVVLEANGTVRILRMIRGLGHGLDEAAADAARAVRFRPASRGGVPVDVNATLHITFQLT